LQKARLSRRARNQALAVLDFAGPSIARPWRGRFSTACQANVKVAGAMADSFGVMDPYTTGFTKPERQNSLF